MGPRSKRTGHGLARVLSKLGYCSRAEAWRLIEAGRVRVNGAVCLDPERRTDARHDLVKVDEATVTAASKVYLMLNKPRGVVVTASDEKGRPTVFDCLRDAVRSHVVPVGRLDRASEGLLLFTNDTDWGARLTDPAARIDKTYHVQVDTLADDGLCRRLEQGVIDEGQPLAAKRAAVIRVGVKNSWLKIVLDEGRNRHIRRLLAAFGIEVRRLVRIIIGPLALADLPKGAYRHLTAAEVKAVVTTVNRIPGRESYSPSD